MRRDQRTRLAPSAVAAVGLHLAVLVAGMLVWPWGKPMQIANVTAITLTPAPAAPPPPALQAPEPQTAAAPEPVPKPRPPKPPPPRPQPTPAPVKPTPPPPNIDPKGIPKPVAAKPKPAEPDFLSSLTTSLDKTTTKPSAAAKGPPRLETAPVARTDPGAEQATANAAEAVGARLNRIWNKSCGVEGFRDVVIRVKFSLTPEGALQGVPDVMDKGPPGNSVWQAAADRAVRAVVQAAPFTELPRASYGQWKTFNAVFDGKVACQNQ
jgi:protein TonB